MFLPRTYKRLSLNICFCGWYHLIKESWEGAISKFDLCRQPLGSKNFRLRASQSICTAILARNKRKIIIWWSNLETLYCRFLRLNIWDQYYIIIGKLIMMSRIEFKLGRTVEKAIKTYQTQRKVLTCDYKTNFTLC